MGTWRGAVHQGRDGPGRLPLSAGSPPSADGVLAAHMGCRPVGPAQGGTGPGRPHGPSSAGSGSWSAQGDGWVVHHARVAWSCTLPCSDPGPSSARPTRHGVVRKTSGPRHWGFWQRGDKRSVGTGGPLWRPARLAGRPFPLPSGPRQSRPPEPRGTPVWWVQGRRWVRQAPRPFPRCHPHGFLGSWPFESQPKASYDRRNSQAGHSTC